MSLGILGRRALRVAAVCGWMALIGAVWGSVHAATFVVTNSNVSGPGSLRNAIILANGLPGADTITFNVPGSGVQVISPATALTTINDALVIDGYTQPGAAPNNLVEGSNAAIRIRIDGSSAGAGVPGLAVCADNVTIRGIAVTGFPAEGIVVGRTGAQQACASAPTGVSVTGSFIGLAPNGVADGNAGGGVTIVDAADTVIGGAAVAARNVISANSMSGVTLDAGAVGSRIDGNLIGTDLTGSGDRGNGLDGVLILGGATGNGIGQRNRIAFNRNGIVALQGAMDNELFFNDIGPNLQLGIDLGGATPDGVTANDPDDADGGANGKQNFPLIASVSRIEGGLHVAASLDRPPGPARTYRIGVYASGSCDPSGFGEGERLLGSVSLPLSGSSESFAFDLPATRAPADTQVTLTATDDDGNTSEFSACAALPPPPLGEVVFANSYETVRLRACRAVDTLATTATGPTGQLPAYLGGGPTGDITGANPNATNFWDFDYTGLNQGAFNTTVQLTDAAGANVGNPVVLFSAGHDYSAFTDGGMCNPVDTFQMVLECNADGALVDLASPTAVNSVLLDPDWTSSSPGAVSVSADGLLTAQAENACATITWSLTSSDPTLVQIDPGSASGSFAACVDSGGVDTATRATWLPVGDVDANYPGLPSGPPPPALGQDFAVTFIVNTGGSGLGAYSARTEYDEALAADNTNVDRFSIGGSTQPGLGEAFAVNSVVANQTRWNDLDAFGTASGIFDLASQTFTATGSGTVAMRYVNEEVSDDSACNIWLANPCMPFSTTVCPNNPPLGGYTTIAGSAGVVIP